MGIDVFDTRFAVRISMMIESRLIWYKHYFYWADEAISSLDDPPAWICEIATIKHIGDALEAIGSYIRSQQLSSVDDANDEYIACLLVRHQIGAISWATLLDDAGRFSDTRGSRCECEYFFSRLTSLENHNYDKTCERAQVAEVSDKFAKELEVISELYNHFLSNFHRFVVEHPNE